jgi:hypothetical protein
MKANTKKPTPEGKKELIRLVVQLRIAENFIDDALSELSDMLQTQGTTLAEIEEYLRVFGEYTDEDVDELISVLSEKPD